MMKKSYLFLLLAAIPAAGLAILSTSRSSNFSETSIENENAGLRTRNYQAGLENFVARAEEIIPTLTTYGQNWRLISANIYENSATVKAEVPVFVFTDDLEIKATVAEGKQGISVNIYSQSRVGINDLGENKRHILQILEALDKKFGEQNSSEF